MPGLVGSRGLKRIRFFFCTVLYHPYFILSFRMCVQQHGAVEEGQISASHESSNFAWCAAKQSVAVFLNIFLFTCL